VAGLFAILALLMVPVTACTCPSKAASTGEHDCCSGTQSMLQAPAHCSDACSSAWRATIGVSDEGQAGVHAAAATASPLPFEALSAGPLASAPLAARTGRPPEPPLILRV